MGSEMCIRDRSNPDLHPCEECSRVLPPTPQDFEEALNNMLDVIAAEPQNADFRCMAANLHADLEQVPLPSLMKKVPL